MLSRKALLLKGQLVGNMSAKSGSQAPMSAYAASMAQRRRKEDKMTANGAIRMALGAYLNAVNATHSLVNSRGQIHNRSAWVKTRTAPLPAEFLSDGNGGGDGGTNGVAATEFASPLASARNESSWAQQTMRQLKRSTNPLKAASEVATARTTGTYFEAPWVTLHKNRKKLSGNRNGAASAVSSTLYTQHGLEVEFGTDPLDVIARNVVETVLPDLHATIDHPMLASGTALRWESVRRLSAASALLRPPLSAAQRRKQQQQENNHRSNTSSPSITATTTTTAMPTSRNPATTPKFLHYFSASPKANLSYKRLLKVPSWPLAAIILDNNPAQNATYRNLLQRWHDVATGDADVRATTTASGGRGGGGGTKNAIPSASSAVTAKALQYSESINRSAIMGQSPVSTLYQLQAFASLGVPLVGLDTLLISAAVDHWHSFESPIEKLVVLRSFVHLAMSRVGVEEGLFAPSAALTRSSAFNRSVGNFGTEHNVLAEEEEQLPTNDPVGGEESITAVGQYLLRTAPAFPTKLAQSTPQMLQFFAARGMLVDYLEVQWHWLLWMGGGMPDPALVEAGSDLPSGGGGDVSGDFALNKKWETLIGGLGSNGGEGADGSLSASTLVQGKQQAILDLYPNTVTADCARSAGFLYWSETCGVKGDVLLDCAAIGGVAMTNHGKNTGDGSSAPSFPSTATDGSFPATATTNLQSNANSATGAVVAASAISNTNSSVTTPPPATGWFSSVYSGDNNSTSGGAPTATPTMMKRLSNTSTAARKRSVGTAAAAVNSLTTTTSSTTEALITRCTPPLTATAPPQLPPVVSITADRPILQSLIAPMTIISEVLRHMWARPSSSSSTTDTPLQIPIPFQRRVRSLQWADDLLGAVAAVHAEVLRVKTDVDEAGEKDGGRLHQQQDENDFDDSVENNNTTPFTFATHRANSHKRRMSDKAYVMTSTTDLSAKLAAAMGELMDTLVDISALVAASGELKKYRGGGRGEQQKQTTTTTTTKSEIVPTGTNNAIPAPDPSNTNESHDSNNSATLKAHLCNTLLPSVVKSTSTLFTKCCEQLLDYPAEVSPLVHISVLDAVRAHHDLAKLHKNLISADAAITSELGGDDSSIFAGGDDEETGYNDEEGAAGNSSSRSSEEEDDIWGRSSNSNRQHNAKNTTPSSEKEANEKNPYSGELDAEKLEYLRSNVI